MPFSERVTSCTLVHMELALSATSRATACIIDCKATTLKLISWLPVSGSIRGSEASVPPYVVMVLGPGATARPAMVAIAIEV